MSKKTGYHHGDLRNQLIQETIRMMHTSRIGNITIRKLSRVVGVSHAAPYRHFPDKRSLMCAVASEGFRMLEDAIVTAGVADGEITLASIERMGVAYVSFAVEHPEFYRLMFSTDEVRTNPSDELRDAAISAYTKAQAIFEEAARSGHLHSKLLPNCITIAWGALHGLATLITNGRIERTINDEISHFLLSDSQASENGDPYSLVRKAMGVMLSGIILTADIQPRDSTDA